MQNAGSVRTVSGRLLKNRQFKLESGSGIDLAFDCYPALMKIKNTFDYCETESRRFRPGFLTMHSPVEAIENSRNIDVAYAGARVAGAIGAHRRRQQSAGGILTDCL